MTVDTVSPPVHTDPPRAPVPRATDRAIAMFAGKGLTRLLIAVLLVVVCYPMFWILATSFKNQNEFLDKPLWKLPATLHGSNYVDAWTNGRLGHNALNSLLVTVPSLAMILVFGAAAGFALEVMVWRGRSTTLLLIVGGIMVPAQIILLPLFTIYFKLGLSNTLWPLIITYVGHGLPLTVFLMATYFRGVPREMFEAATIDGAGIYRMFWSVAVPMVRNGLFTVALLMFFSIWNDLLIALTFNVDKNLQTVQVGLLNFSDEYGSLQYGPLFAAISITVFSTLLVYVFINRQVMRGLTAGSVKG
ncbi:raffinose/stachyose/melibiose transport system permease protein [Kribbella aluminosa]|uniref:Raffinose/stachyose/melibiose transport system permease protein n=1 Tax=Kribbella aluminosa TaxID=416017 RepID=A0ABS4UTS9_9ACTN|nr:carbohydrate ABC transporter permease [Kribbella aluminosa]MBP2355037.1 raffinose/stachyose/melibiose transport system permease protein [Kribbella aluminosa]